MIEHYIAIDLGAESGRLILGTLKNQRIKYEVIHRFPTKATHLFDSFRWNLLRFWEEIIVGLKKVTEKGDLNIKGIAIDSWGANLVYLTEDNELACYPFHYRDSLTEIGNIKMRQLFDMEKVFEITGLQEMPFNGLVHLSGVYAKYPEIFNRIKKIIMIPDYFNYLLTGNLHTEYTLASTTQLFDVREKNWSDKLLKSFGMNSTIFPKVVQPGTLLGTLNKDVKEEVGLGDIPIYSVASHDTGSAVVGVPADDFENNWAYLSSGTWSLLGVEIDKPIINEKVRKFNFTNEGGAFNTIRLLKNIIGLWPIQQCKEIWDQKLKKQGKTITYDFISEEASKEEPNKSIIDVDDPLFYNPKNMIKTIQNYCEKNKKPLPKSVGQITRCIYDSLAMKYREVIEMIEQLTDYHIDQLYIIGGGSQVKLLNQITANILGIEIYAGLVEATAVGNIMMQAYANGSVSSLKEIREIIRNSFELTMYKPS